LIRYGVVKEVVPSETVSIGTRVKVSQNGEEKQFEIVGAYEADPKMGKISEVSPLGKLLVGKRVGDTVTVAAPAGNVSYTITAISS
jgi:transcription elongation factor GreA